MHAPVRLSIVAALVAGLLPSFARTAPPPPAIPLLARAAAARAEIAGQQDDLDATVIDFLMADEIPVSHLARMLTQASGRTVVASRAAGQLPCSAFFENVPFEECIKVVCRMHGLWYKKSGTDIIELITADEYRDGLALYKDEYVEVIPVLYPSVNDLGLALSQLYADRVIWLESSASNSSYERMEDAMDRMDLLLDRAQFGTDGATSAAGSSSSYTSSNSGGYRRSSRYGNTTSRSSSGGLRSGNTRSASTNFAQADQQITKSMEIENQQRQNFLALATAEQIAGGASMREITGASGLVYLSAFADTNSLLVRSHDRVAVDEIKAVIKKLDVVAPQVLLEVRVLELSLSDNYEQGVDWSYNRSNFASAFGAEQVSLSPANVLASYVGADFSARLKLYAKDGRLTALATPTLLVRDNEASRIFIGQETTILESVTVSDSRTVVNGISTGSLSVDPQTSRRNLGDTLLITPKIHPDRTITLRILHENSQGGSTQRITYGGNSGDYFESTPVEQRTITTTVVAKDNEPVVIGGLIREELTDNEEGVPLLRSIPLLGNAFKQRVKGRARSELIVVIRPMIQIAPGETADASQRFLERNSQHPAAQGDIPPLDVTRPGEMLLPEPASSKKAERRVRRLQRR
ncbi:type II secretion system protein GspD [Termitidicoccus mucosus]|uniref:Type II/III secretion system secretin-like domain-containing protein n=1 Tax=Termitidicoccus mucosus TaxID=1184151 RepID=A0A178IN04_9BACT|nr:hypothetical protein AW736_07190 [Opitutaceae bacterium TSB47]